jgi:DNA polymerase phi
MKVLNEHSLQFASLVFTKNLIRCFMNQLGVEDRYLHPMAVKASKMILNRASKDSDFAVVAVDSLLGPSGSVNFDKITKSKLVEKMVTTADVAALKRMIAIFERQIAESDSSETKATASGRDILANFLVSMFRTLSSDEEDNEPTMEKILSILTRIAYTGDSQNPQVFRNRINACLNSLISNNENPAKLAYSVVLQIRDLQRSNESGKVIEMDDSIRESVDGAFKSLKRLFKNLQKDKTSQEALLIQTFALLYSMTILQIYNGDADAISMLDELAFCYSKFWGDQKSKGQGAADAADASNALVEILLSFASKPSQLFRRMSEQVFTVFADQISADGLQSLTSVSFFNLKVDVF